MDFRHIQHFVHTAELGSLSKAAERLNIVQPALSQSIKRLEQDLGTLLFTRSRRGMELTESGRMFLKYAYGILNQLNRAKESISAIGENPKGLVSVAMTASALHVLTVPVCSMLSEFYPDIELSIEEGLAGNIQQGFEAGHYDLVVSYLVKADASIHIENLIEEELYLTMPYDGYVKLGEVRFKDLQNMPLIIPQAQHGVGKTIERYARDLNVNIKSAQISGALHPTLQLVEAGFGNSLLPWSAIYDRVEQKKVTAQAVIEPSILHTVSMMYPSHRPLTQASMAVMQVLRQAVKQVHDDGKWPGKLLVTET